MKGHKVLTSSNSDEWSTDQNFYDVVNKEFKFKMDMAATKENSKCILYSSDSLDVDWILNDWWLWCNPPYSKVKEFTKKAYDESVKGAATVMLIPARTDTKYWHENVSKACEIRFIKGRLKFGNSKHSAPFPSALVIFDRERKPKSNVIFWDWKNDPTR